MALHLIGDTLDKTRSHYRAGTGQLIQLMRGIYVDSDDDIDAVIMKHAVRIAKYLYPQAYLSAASAVLLGPTQDGRLFLSARRKQRTRIRSLEIIQNQAPLHPSVGAAIVDDGMGEFRINASSIRQRFLEAFRIRSEHAAAIDEEMRKAIAIRLSEEYGSPHAAADAIWVLARENEWYREGEAAERYLRRTPTVGLVKNRAAFDLIVAWHGRPIGQLNHDGFEWRWNAIKENGPALIRQTTPGKLPPFIVSLMPEGWLESVLKNADERTQLKSGKRYMSNVTIVEQQSELATLPEDILITRLLDYDKDGTFTGRYAGPGRDLMDHNFERNLASIYQNAETPRLSGIQIKAPMYLDVHGVLSPSTDKPFTHILKPAGTSGFDFLPIIEWLDMSLGRAIGFDVPAAVLIKMPDGMPPALLVERFDIREGRNDKRMLALEDFCSVLDLSTAEKYTGTMERVARAVRSLSTSPEEDLLILVKRALFAWLVADGDMHLKNMALLKTAEPGDKTFRTVRVAPLYDSVTTRVFPGLQHDRMALKLNGKDERLRRADFRALAKIAGLSVTDTDNAIDEMLERMRAAVDEIVLPPDLDYADEAARQVERVLEICRNRLNSFK